MKNYRLTYKKRDSNQDLKLVFSTIIQAKSMKGALKIAENLEPFQWDFRILLSIEDEKKSKNK